MHRHRLWVIWADSLLSVEGADSKPISCRDVVAIGPPQSAPSHNAQLWDSIGSAAAGF